MIARRRSAETVNSMTWSRVRNTLPTWRRSLIIATLLLSGCGGGGERPEPIQAGLVGGQGTSDPSLRTITARGGTELFLNGENSDGVRFPIENAVWRQTDSSGMSVRLDKRTEFTRAVQLPFVDEATELSFELTATNEEGEQSVTPIEISVLPASDGNRFLEFVTVTPNEYTVVAALKPGMQTLTDVDFTITQTRLADYPARNGAQQSDVPFGSTETRSSQWLSETVATHSSAVEGVNAHYHPNVCFDLPRIDIDDINVLFDDTADAELGVPDHRRDAVSQRVELSLEVGAGSCLDSNDDAIPCQDAAQILVVATNGELLSGSVVENLSDTQIRVNVEAIAASAMPNPANGQPASTLRQPESAASATAYYEAVDPNNLRTTLGDWLDFTGFSINGELDPNSGADHVTYINNYDLGFTRDMFMRVDGDKVFAYVTNYPALRTATFGTDVLATVAMEFGPPDQTPDVAKEDYIVKFFVFVPESTAPDAVQHRVKSLNFDGRGEKWVPGACMPCHGGKLKDLEPGGTFPGFGNTEAAFLPWDIDSFLFAKSDDPVLQDPVASAGFDLNPGYIKTEDLNKISLESQQDSFRRMNEGVLKTLSKDDGRFDLVRRQVHGWYGNCPDPLDIAACDAAAESDTLPPNDFDSLGFIQPGWEGKEDIYHEVFGKHCRVCHSQAKDINQFLTFDDLANNRNTLPYLFEDGIMPNARLDMDRFWVDFRGSSVTPAARLGAALGLTPEQIPADGPGAPIARIRGDAIMSALPRDLLSGALETRLSEIDVENDNSVRLDGSVSAFADTYAWEIITRPSSSNTRLVGANTAKPAFKIDSEGTYEIGLVVSNGRGASAQQTVTVLASTASPQMVANRLQAITLEESIPGDTSSVVITNELLQFVDADSNPDEIFFTITAPPENGRLFSSIGELGLQSQFTQAEIDAGEIRYEQTEDKEVPTDRFDFTIMDAEGASGGESTFNFTITTRNDAPKQIVDERARVETPGTEIVINEDVLEWRDFDETDPEVTFTLTRTTAFGELRLNGTALSAGQTFTQTDVSTGQLTYAHDVLNPQRVDSFDYNVTHANVTLGPQTFSVDILIPLADPQLEISNFQLQAGDELQILAGTTVGTDGVVLSVTDADTISPDDLFITVENLPNGAIAQLVLRDANDNLADFDASTVLGAGAKIPLSALLTADASGQNGLYYVSTRNPQVTEQVTDEFGLSVTDSDDSVGTCLPATGSNVCVIDVTTIPRLIGNESINVELDSLLDPARARLGNATALDADLLDTEAEREKVPWNDVEINEADLGFADGATYRLVSYAAPARGFLKTGDAPLNTVTEANRVIAADDAITFPVFYANREVPDTSGTITPHRLTIEVSDGTITRMVAVEIQPAIDVQTDIGWLVDATFTRQAGQGVPGGCSLPNPAQNECRSCHAVAACVRESNLWKAEGATAAGGNIDCAVLSSHFPNQLPDFPTDIVVNSGHVGGKIFSADTLPHDLLKAWNGVCP